MTMVIVVFVYFSYFVKTRQDSRSRYLFDNPLVVCNYYIVLYRKQVYSNIFVTSFD